MILKGFMMIGILGWEKRSDPSRFTGSLPGAFGMAYGKLVDRFTGSVFYLLIIVVQGENDLHCHEGCVLFPEFRPEVHCQGVRREMEPGF